MKSTAFVLPPAMTKKVQRMQERLQVEEPGEVIGTALDLLDIAIGRKIVLQEKDRSVTINDLKDYDTTYSIDDGSKTESK